jgi:predicted GNAT family N-acyltransferase
MEPDRESTGAADPLSTTGGQTVSPIREMSGARVIEEIVHGGADYRAALDWRERILRRPLGLVLTENDTVGEDSQRHFVLRNGEVILAGVIAVSHEPGTIRLRQMWVREDLAGTGLGRSLLEGVARIFRAEGSLRITLHARVAVRGFYEKCGYTAEGTEFEEIGIPHIRMIRRIENG